MRRLWLIVSLTLAFPATLPSQTLAGAVTRAGIPVEGAIVQLLDNANREIARAVSRDDGRYTLRAQPGSYSVRVIQMGWRPTTTGPFELRGSETTSGNVTLTSPRLSLSAITVRGQSACAVRPDSSVAAFAVWEAARGALMATSMTRLEPYDVKLTRNERSLSADSRNILSDSSMTQSGRSLNPVRSLPATTIAASGYISADASGQRSIWAPDADVLLSDEFLGSHCLAAQASEADSTLVGVRFEPTRRRRDIVEVEGVLWVDRRTTELRSLEYRYVHGSDALTKSQAGGTVEFLRIGRGRWFVSRWSIRQPVIRERTEGQGNVIPGQRSASLTREELAGIKISSGSILEVSRNDVRVWERGRVSLVARVIDSASGAPRSRVLVGLDASSEASSTDSLGFVRLDLVEPGSRVVRVDDPELRAIGVDPLLRGVEVPPYNDAVVDVRVPSVRTFVAAQCGARSLAWGEGMLYGRLARRPTIDSAGTVIVVTMTPFQQLGGGPIEIENSYEVTPAVDGSFRVCGLARDATVHVRKASQQASAGVTVRFESGAYATAVSLP